MIGILLTIFSVLYFFYDVIISIFQVFGEYVPAWLSMVISVIAVARAYCPVELQVVALVCISTMITRFIYNAVRGSGA